MAKAWILVVCVVACGNSGSPSGSSRTEIEEQPVDPPAMKPDAAEPLDAAEAVAAPDPDPVPLACLSSAAQVTAVNLRGKELRACFDETGDDKPDHCVRWRRDTGAVIAVEPVFDVEATDAKTDPAPPVEFHTQDVNDDDRRIELTDDVADICPPDRACMRIKPLLADGQEVAYVYTDGPFRTAVFAIKSPNDSTGRLEFWDLQTGRLRGRQPLKSDSVKLRVSNASVLVLWTTSKGTRGSIYGLDGSPRGAFADDLRNLDDDNSTEVADTYVIANAPADKPYTVLVTSLATAQTLARFTIPNEGGSITMNALGALAIVKQDGDQLRFDVIDVHGKTTRALIVPSC